MGLTNLMGPKGPLGLVPPNLHLLTRHYRTLGKPRGQQLGTPDAMVINMFMAIQIVMTIKIFDKIPMAIFFMAI